MPVAEFKIEYKQILDPKGNIVAPLPKFAADVGDVVRMYQAMTRVRVFDAKAVNLQRTGQLGTYPSSLGHEAAHVGVILNVVRKVNKSLSYVTTGQEVPNDIEVGKGRELARRIMGNDRMGADAL